jgi:glycosyltransferase involved in cell wall biosynthesis
MAVESLVNSSPSPPGSMPRAVPLLSVAICTRNRAALMEKALRSVLAQDPKIEILVVDNGSTDATCETCQRVAAEHPNVRFTREPELGVSAARNRALVEASGEWVLFLDDDALAGPGWVSAYRDFLQDQPADRIALVGGAVFPDYVEPPPGWVDPRLNRLFYSEVPGPFRSGAGPWGGNLAVHRRIASSVGSFATGLGRKGPSLGADEEGELARRSLKAGYSVWWLPHARIHHRIAPDRMSLHWVCRNEFGMGRAKVLQRLAREPRMGRRIGFLLARLAIAPFHCAFNVLVAAVLWPWQRGRLAANAIRRTSRNAGFGWELLRQAGPCLVGRQPDLGEGHPHAAAPGPAALASSP